MSRRKSKASTQQRVTCFMSWLQWINKKINKQKNEKV